LQELEREGEKAARKMPKVVDGTQIHAKPGFLIASLLYF